MRLSLCCAVTFLLLHIPLSLRAEATAAGAGARPNILLVMVDDMGWSDLGCYGGEVDTPHIDSLASGGLRFSAFYNTGRCCPTRASLLTGLYPHRAGLGQMTFDTELPGYRGQLSEQSVTIAEVLRDHDYRTAMVGKWHLSLTQMRDDHIRHLNNQVIREQFAPLDSYPVGRGFEEHYGIIWGVINYFDPFSLVHNKQAIQNVPEDYYITDAFTDQTLQYLERYAGGEEPFFIYLAHTAPHWPLHALPEDIARYAETYTQGWQAIREQRYARQIDMSLIDPQTAPLSERLHPQKRWQSNQTRDWDARAMAVHAAMIDRVDQGMGRIIAKLQQLGIYENTLILVLSDNGASPEEPGRPGFDRASETRTGEPIVYYGQGAAKEILPGPETTYAGIGPDWANVANTPFRFHKATQYEGGIRTPLIVHWPAGLKQEAGSITAETGHVIDILPTCLELADARYPATHHNEQIMPLDGKSLLPILHSGQRDGHDALFFEHFGHRAVRQGPWKLVARPDADWQLYHLAEDQTETTDLAARHPDQVERLAKLWKTWAEQAQVFPQP